MSFICHVPHFQVFAIHASPILCDRQQIQFSLVTAFFFLSLHITRSACSDILSSPLCPVTMWLSNFWNFSLDMSKDSSLFLVLLISLFFWNLSGNFCFFFFWLSDVFVLAKQHIGCSLDKWISSIFFFNNCVKIIYSVSIHFFMYYRI